MDLLLLAAIKAFFLGIVAWVGGIPLAGGADFVKVEKGVGIITAPEAVAKEKEKGRSLAGDGSSPTGFSPAIGFVSLTSFIALEAFTFSGFSLPVVLSRPKHPFLRQRNPQGRPSN